MYTGYELSDSSRKKLEKVFPPKYPEFLGHHITEQFGVGNDTPPPPAPNTATVVGYADDGKGIEGLLVSIDGNTSRPSGGLYHITWSLDSGKGYKPFHTNKIIGSSTQVDPIPIDVTPKFFTGSTKQELQKKSLKDFVKI